MTFRIPAWVLILAFIVVLGAFFWLGGVTARQDRDRLAKALKTAQKAYNDTIHMQRIMLDGVRQTLVKKDAIILSQKEAIQAGFLDKQRLKKINAGVVRTNTKLKATINTLKDSLHNYNRIVLVRDTAGYVNAMRLPATFNYADEYFKLGVNVKRDTWNFNALATVPATITVGDQVIITTPNPYVKFTKVNSVVVPPKTKLWDKKWFRWTERFVIAGGFFWLGRQ